MIYFCASRNRRALVLQHPSLNGIDYMEVVKGTGDCGKTLVLTMLKDARRLGLTLSQIDIAGGAEDAQLKVLSIDHASAAAPETISIHLNQPGDFATYTLTLQANSSTTDPPAGIDPQLASVTFSFRAGCAVPADCLPCNCCPPNTTPPPDINYMAKDYGGFLQVMLDRMSVLTPSWDQAHVPDIGVALVEALAYAADHLSYQQDAVGTEQYIGTARSRISLRRLARLVDYQIDPGCNARTCLFLYTNEDGVTVPKYTLAFPRVPGFLPTVKPDSPQGATLLANPLGFATMQPIVLQTEQNQIDFYTWDDTDCCLPVGATSATFAGNLTTLAIGSLVLFEEIVGPLTGDPGDADPSHRWIVRLTGVRTTDYLLHKLVDPLNMQPITQVSWACEDALPFPLCLSSMDANGNQLYGVSVARGNIVYADHGIWQGWQDLGIVPAAPPTPIANAGCACNCEDTPAVPRPRYYPELPGSPVTFAWPRDYSQPVSQFLAPISSASSRATPKIKVRDNQGYAWNGLYDLLSSTGSDRVYALEIERDNSAFLRFGDGQYGMAPETGMDLQAAYRVGNGTAGNVGRDSLAHLLTDVKGIAEVRNPLAATGGVDPETVDHIRQYAPFAFQTQLRAVTEADYGTMAMTLSAAIQSARGTLRWTGSWYTAFVSVETKTENGPSAKLIAAVKSGLNLYRMAGVDLEVEGAVIIGLRIEIGICVAPEFFQADVRTALFGVFTTGNQCTGQPGLLNPLNFTFGETLYTSPFVAAAQAVPGVSSVTMTLFQRMDDPSIDGVALGYLAMAALEIARCDNNPSRLDYGIITFNMDGGK